MLGLSATIRVFVAVAPTDLRKGYDGLAQLAREVAEQDPLSGHWFVFANRRRDRVKILYWDRDGFALWQKRLETGTFEFPKVIGEAAGVAISATELSLILGGVALNAKRRPRYTTPEKSSGS